ncbi:MAG: hypothetical protein AAFO99_00555 [Bacteroidota bacterium]
MYTLAVILSFCSIWSLFSAANKVEFDKKNITLTFSKKTRVTKIVALVSFLGAMALLWYLLGAVVGILASTVIWMILASLVVLFAPFPKFRGVHLILIVALLLCIELLLNFMI